MQQTNIEKIKNSKNVWENLNVNNSPFYQYYRFNHVYDRFECSSDSIAWWVSVVGDLKQNNFWLQVFNELYFKEQTQEQKELTNFEKIKNSKNVWENLNVNNSPFANYYRFNHQFNQLECSFDNFFWIESYIGGLLEHFNKLFFVELNNENTSTTKELNNLSPLELLMTNPDQEFVLSDGQHTFFYRWSSKTSCLNQKVLSSYGVTDIKAFINFSQSVLQKGGTFIKYSDKIERTFDKLHAVASPIKTTLRTYVKPNNQYAFDVMPNMHIDLNGNFSDRNDRFNSNLTIQEIDRQIELLQYVKELKKLIDS